MVRSNFVQQRFDFLFPLDDSDVLSYIPSVQNVA